MPMELDLRKLSFSELDRCLKTISINTFFMLVGDALEYRKPLSVVRMGDGEKRLYLHCETNVGTIEWPNSPFGDDWLRDFGCLGIPCGELYRRIKVAANECTYFSPQIMGIQREQWAVHDLFRQREQYVDNWFVSQWDRQRQDQLLKHAGEVLLLHGDQGVRDAFALRVHQLGGRAECIEMRNWQHGDMVIAEAAVRSPRLILFSGGPANKYIAPAIAQQGKVVLDIGQAFARCWV